jgi:pimeloyl-ACP methyl ester carboxylesterase
MARFRGEAKAFAVNLPGHPRGEITCKTVEDYAASVAEFIEETGINRPVVCGHSMGSAVSLILELMRPELVSGMVLVGGGAKLGVLPDILNGLSESTLSTIERTITPRSYFSVDLETARAARRALSLENPAVFLNDYKACLAFDVRSRLPDIAQSAIIVCGEQDKMTPPKWSHYLHAHLTNSKAFFVRESGHMVPLEKPEVCSQLIAEYLVALTP